MYKKINFQPLPRDFDTSTFVRLELYNCVGSRMVRSSQSMTLEMACSSNSRVLLAKSWDIWDVHDTELTAFQLGLSVFQGVGFWKSRRQGQKRIQESDRSKTIRED